MTSIHILPDHLINKIAAGEVIENPASVVKELVDNSIDAQATEIQIFVEAGGYSSIIVSDDGVGMSKEDLCVAFERHATSKIKSFDDLFSLHTMGFRGEALASISSIAKLKVETSHNNEAYLAHVEGGKIKTLTPSHRLTGTTIEIRSLFYNIPVRRKFQKSLISSMNQIYRSLNKIALAHPQISFTFIADQQKRFHYPTEDNLSFEQLLDRRIKNVLGQEIFSSMIPLHWSQDQFTLHGFIYEPLQAKKTRAAQYLIVNKRPVSCVSIAEAIKQGYKTRIAEQLFPGFVLHCFLPSACVDVNVHPQKKEIRLKEDEKIKQHISTGVSLALQRSLSQQESQKFIPPIEAVQFSNTKQIFSDISLERREEEEKQLPELNLSYEKQSIDFSPLILVGKYLLIESQQLAIKEKKGELFSIHLPYAYNQCLFESLNKQTALLPSQDLLIPLTVEVTNEEMFLFEKLGFYLSHMGFSSRAIGNTTICIDSHPTFLNHDKIIFFVREFLEELAHFSFDKQMDDKQKNILNQHLAKISFSIKNIFTIKEATYMVKKLFSLKDFYYSPSGKPIIVSVEENDLDLLLNRKK